MTTAPPLASLHIAGFRSIRDTRIELSSPITLLIGANGSGKSNIVAAFELLGRIVDRQLQEHILRLGGMSAAFYAAPVPNTSAETVILEAWGSSEGGLRHGYEARLDADDDDRALLQETTLFHDQSRFPDPYDAYLSTGRESVLARTSGKAWYSYSLLEGCRVFHFDDVSRNAPPKTTCSVADNITLAPDAANLAALLLNWQREHPHTYDRMVRAVRSVAPYFDDFVLRPTGENVLLRWRERAVDRVFSANSLSDGTLRFICLATLLLQPDLPRTIVLDEPELGLHPFAVHQLAGLLRGISADRRIIAATQSTALLSQFHPDEVAVVERSERGSEVRRLHSTQLSGWLEEYSLGELWEKNLLGGRPRPDGIGLAVG